MLLLILHFLTVNYFPWIGGNRFGSVDVVYCELAEENRMNMNMTTSVHVLQKR